MSAFDRLNASLQHHVVNTLGWATLRPHQDQAIEPVLRGEHVLIQAPTAGGKTEAALLPVLSRMLDEAWGRPAVLYLCPLKALLNDLETRIYSLAALVGRRVAVWHSDVSTAARRRITRDPPDILLATPESVEVMLVSRLVEHRLFFAQLRAVIVDEVHAFAGDDRGWHLLALLERLSRLAENPVQRIALSATLANGEELLRWLTAGADEPQRVITGAHPERGTEDVQIDYVGSVENAALVISRLHAGEKRLVFCDSRSQVESLAAALRAYGVTTYVSHSSLSRDERLRAEAAFAQGSDCVIVATSTLELGIDVGDLDRVIQIDAPYSVAAFLQRLGRTGRRPGSRRNCLFLATTEDALLRAAAITLLWQEGYVEPVEPPPLPYHVLAQQILALALQEGGVERASLNHWLEGFCATAKIGAHELDELVQHMCEESILFEDGGLLSIGAEGEARYGMKNFLEVFSVFLSPPYFQVYHGRNEIGQVHEQSFRRGDDGFPLLSLGGRGWKITHVDWSKRRAYVEPADMPGRSRWLGHGQVLHFDLCQAVRCVLSGADLSPHPSQRAANALEELRTTFSWIGPTGTVVAVEHELGEARWWTFAGDPFNSAAAAALMTEGIPASYDSFSVRVRSSRSDAIVDAIRKILEHEDGLERGIANVEGREQIKFDDCIGLTHRAAMTRARNHPGSAAERIGLEPVRLRATH